jgi:predicted lipoprotein with Yx(FWY)xxD motif
MKHTTSLTLGLVLSALLAGCSGGGGSTGPSSFVATPPMVPSTTAAAATLAAATIDGSLTFVTSTNQPVYVDSADTTDTSFCTSVGNCIGLWPAVIAPSGPLSAGFSSFTRSDNGQVQLAFNGRPLYTFVGDTSPDVATGVGIADPASSGGTGTFTLAHPVASTSTAAPAAPANPYAIGR